MRRNRHTTRLAVLAVLAVVATVVGGCGGDRAVSVDAAGTGPRPAPAAVPAAQVTQGPVFPGIFPFTSQAEVDAYAAGSDTTYRDPVRTVRQFAVEYLGTEEPVLSAFRGGGDGAGDVSLSIRPENNPQPHEVTVVSIRQLGPRGPTGPWTVTGALSPEIHVDTPRPLDRISSPARVTGRARAFEANVTVQVREDGMRAGAALGRGFVTAADAVVLSPFSGEVPFSAPSRPGGAVLFVDVGGVGPGEPVSVTVVRVGFRVIAFTG